MLNEVRRRALDEVKRIVLGGLAGRRTRVYLFGSCARGNPARFSDIDVAVEPLDPIPAGVFVDLRDALEDSDVPYFVDLVDLSEAGDRVRSAVRREGIEWTA